MTQVYFAERVPYAYVSPVTEGTVGTEIVRLADELESLDAYGDPDDVTQKVRNELDTELSSLDNDLNKLTAIQRKRLAPYLHSLDADIYQADPENAHFHGLPQNDPAVVDRLIAMDPADKVQFMRKHVSVVSELIAQESGFIEQQRKQYVEDTRRGVAEGWLSPKALKVIQTVPGAPIVVRDWWTSGVAGEYGAYDIDTDTIFLRQGIGVTAADRAANFRGQAEPTIPHELNHREYEQSPEWNYDRWLAEAMAEGVALMMENGKPGVLDPEVRQDVTGPHGSSAKELTLAARMIEGLDPVLLTRAYSSGDTASPEWQELRSELHRKYGTPEVIRLITNRVSYYDNVFSQTLPELHEDKRYDKALDTVTSELEEKTWLITGVRFPRVHNRLGKLFIKSD